MVRLPDINDILEKIIDYRIFNDYQYNNKLISILYSCITYGSYETLVYLQNRKPRVFIELSNDYYNTNYVVNLATSNKDIRVTKFIFKLYSKMIPTCNLEFEFLLKFGKDYNKIKKLKLISKYIDFKELTNSQFNSLFDNKIKNIEVKKWILKKYSMIK